MEFLTYVVLAAFAVILFFWYRESRPASKIRHFEDKAEDSLSGYRSQRVTMYDDDQLPKEVTLMQDFYAIVSLVCQTFDFNSPGQIALSVDDTLFGYRQGPASQWQLGVLS